MDVGVLSWNTLFTHLNGSTYSTSRLYSENKPVLLFK